MTPFLLPGGEFGAFAVGVQVGMVCEFPIQRRVQQDLGYHHSFVHRGFKQAQEDVALIEVRCRNRGWTARCYSPVQMVQADTGPESDGSSILVRRIASSHVLHYG